MTEGIVKSAGRALEVLEVFARERRALNAKQVECELRYPPSSTVMLLKSLMLLGYLRFDRRTKLYYPTLRVTLLGDWLRTGATGSDALLGAMQALASRTQETVFLSTPNDVYMQVTHIVQGQQPISLNVQPGLLLPMAGTAVGHAYLSTRNDEDITKLVRRMNRSRATEDRHDPAAVVATVRGARRRGHATAYGVLEDVGAIARAVPSHDGATAAVICIGGPAERIRGAEATLARELRRCTGIYFRARRRLGESAGADG